MIVECSLLLNAKSTRVGKVINVHVRSVFIQILMINPLDSFFFKVYYINLTLRNIEYNDFFVVHLAESINDIIILVLVEYFPGSIKMNNAFLLTRFIHSSHNKGVIICDRYAQYFSSLLLQFYAGWFF